LRLEIEKDLGAPAHQSSEVWTFWCPFVQEKTVGGFKVWADRYKCFSCGEAGDVFDWRQKIHDQTLIEAVNYYGGGTKLDGHELLKYTTERAEQAAKELEDKIALAQKALSELREAQIWVKYHESLSKNQQARDLWTARGVSEWWQDWWKLGYCESYSLWKRGDTDWEAWWKSPTISFPVWGHDWEVYNVKHRLLQEPPEGGKYIQEKKRVPQYPFITNPDIKKNKLLLLEGEIKAMVTFIVCDDIDLQVAGIPGDQPSDECLKTFDDYDPIYVCLDPDAYEVKRDDSPVNKVIKRLGTDRTRVIWIPAKIDDAIIENKLNKNMIKRLMESARRTNNVV